MLLTDLASLNSANARSAFSSSWSVIERGRRLYSTADFLPCEEWGADLVAQKCHQGFRLVHLHTTTKSLISVIPCFEDSLLRLM